jgi:hypothetical protein
MILNQKIGIEVEAGHMAVVAVGLRGRSAARMRWRRAISSSTVEVL